MKSKTFWKAFLATMALATIGFLIITYPTHKNCAKDPEDVGVCNRVDRIVHDGRPFYLFVAIPMSVFIGLIANGMKPTEKEKQKKEK